VPTLWHSAKNFLKKNKKIFCRVPDTSPLGKGDVRRAVSVRSTFLCRVLTWHSAKALPSARYIALGKEPFADKSYAGGSLPSVTLGKLFAECKLGFAECLGHSAKNPCPVVKSSWWLHTHIGSYTRWRQIFYLITIFNVKSRNSCVGNTYCCTLMLITLI